MENFEKIVRLGTVPEWTRRGTSQVPTNVFCSIKYADGKLSISGVVGPMSNGDCRGSCGQINMGLDPADVTPAAGWTLDTLKRFLEVWNAWHLNDMQAGTPRQTAEVERRKADFPGYPKSHYEWALEILKEAGLQPDPDTGYSYGSKWLKVEVPEDVLTWLADLPATDKKPAWV